MKLACAFALFALAVRADVTVTVDHNMGAAATTAFKFARVPSPSREDVAAPAKVDVIAGTVDRNSAPVTALTDGRLPGNQDEPEANLFFRGDSWGGRVRIDLGSVAGIAAVNSYSWHPDTRAPQVYRLYASDGTDPHFKPAPDTKADLATSGWREIAFVDTRPKAGEGGGQYGVAITDSTGSLGRYRYLLFDFYETESDDSWGQTFYSEIDVVKK